MEAEAKNSKKFEPSVADEHSAESDHGLFGGTAEPEPESQTECKHFTG